MKALSHSLKRLSTYVALGVGLSALEQPTLAGAAARAVNPIFGRWTVAKVPAVFTARGQTYKTIDIMTCGHDFCGVSVSDANKCGATLFRFHNRHFNEAEFFSGHGKWGNAIKNIEIEFDLDSDGAGRSGLEINLGDGHNFGGRSDNMPKFHANYRKLGGAQCTTG